MKSDKINSNITTETPDWNKPQLVEYNGESDIPYVILTDGTSTLNSFGGTVVFIGDNRTWKIGSYNSSWIKIKFKPLGTGIKIQLEN